MNSEKSEQIEVKKIIEELGKLFGDHSSDAQDLMLMKMYNTGVPPKDAMGINNEKMEALYSQAYVLYNTGKYRDALVIFRMLIMMDPAEVRYLIGLAASFHLLKEYRTAIDAYMACIGVDPNNPIPFFHLSDCYYQINDKASALITLEMAVNRSGDKPEYQMLKDRALLTMTSIKKDIEKIFAQQNLNLGEM